MKNPFAKRPSTEPPALYPPWEAGQYVTYIHELEGPDEWIAFKVNLHGKVKDGRWAFSVDFKSPFAENRVWFSQYPAAADKDRSTFPGKMEVVRAPKSKPAGPMAAFLVEPVAQATVAINVLYVAQNFTRRGATLGDARTVDYSCGISHVYPFSDPVGDYELNPRVMLTGVASSGSLGGPPRMKVTSFGSANPLEHDSGQPACDWIDLSHMAHVEHEGFALNYPATWFLQEQVDWSQPDERHYLSQVGGASCAAILSVSIYTGAPDHLAQERETLISRLNQTPLSVTETETPRGHEAIGLEGGDLIEANDLETPDKDGITYTAFFDDPASNRMVSVTTLGVAWKSHPRQRQILSEMESVFRQILESFRLT